jgi:hypothetical protein
VEPGSFGRKLGIGVRVASRVVKERMDAHAQQAANPAANHPADPPPPSSGAPREQTSRVESASRQAAENLRQSTEKAAQTVRQQAPVVAAKARGVREGSRRFGKAMWGPFAHVSSVLWSEVTGAFFALFMFYFALGIYRYHADYRAGVNHQKFIIHIVLTLIFGYFTVSSFYIARRKERKRR